MSAPTVSFPRSLDHATLAALMARKAGTWPRVVPGERGRGWRIDCRPHGPFLYGVGTDEYGRRRRFQTQELAQAVADHLKVEVARGVPPAEALEAFLPASRPERQLVTKAAKWLAAQERRVAAGDVSETTLVEWRRYLDPERYFRFWRGIPARAVTKGHLEDWSVWLAEEIGIGANTRGKALQTLRSVLLWLEDRGEIRRAPRMPRLEVPEHLPTVLSMPEQARVLAAIPDRLRGIYLVLAHGARPGEARALNVEDWRPSAGVVRLRAAMKGQGPKARRVPFTKERTQRDVEADAELVAWLGTWARPDEIGAPLFRDAKGGRWTHGALVWYWRRAVAACGLPPVGLYEGTKHTVATDAVRRGLSLYQVQHALGHASPKSTERYAKLAQGAPLGVLRPKGAFGARPKGEPS